MPATVNTIDRESAPNTTRKRARARETMTMKRDIQPFAAEATSSRWAVSVEEEAVFMR
jgi:hypothetical protein